MSTENEFERRLESHPHRPVPAAWREEILRAARTAAVTSPSSVASRPSMLSAIQSQLSGLFWPHPRVWASLGAVWLLLLAVNLAIHEPGPRQISGQTGPPSSQMRELLRQQEQMFTELAGLREGAEPDQPKSVAPRPRSQRHEDHLNA